jgi:choline dehydrogenase-like flavoprotein
VEFTVIEQFSDSVEGAVFETEVCVVGAGAAGITLARRLAASGIEVCLLESGGADYEKPSQDLASGESIGFSYYPLAESRLRLFGGTTAVWGGRVVELDPIDFERRSWIEHSGWPFGKETLAPYYAEAMRSLDFDTSMRGEKIWNEIGLNPPGFDSKLLRTDFFQFDEQFERYTLRRCGDLVESAKVHVLLHATVLEIQADSEGTEIESVRIGNLAGGRGVVRAKTFVLATGGLEVPRMLLNSRGVHREGLGNREDLVGRFFMEHPHARAGRVHARKMWKALHILPRTHRHNGFRYAALGRASEALQERYGVLNSSFTLALRRHPVTRIPLGKRLVNAVKWKVPHDHRGRSVWWMQKQIKRVIAEHIGMWNRWAIARSGAQGLYVVARAEQAPNPDSRIVLSEELDPFGLPKMALDWRFLEVDKRSLSVLMGALDHELNRLGIGRVEASPWLADESTPWEVDPLVSNHPIGGFHHMGTTRMAASAKHGVVDADCRVHGLGNLYIAGSSVFPTGGWANPTLTILALSLRLGDHLAQKSQSIRLGS